VPSRAPPVRRRQHAVRLRAPDGGRPGAAVTATRAAEAVPEPRRPRLLGPLVLLGLGAALFVWTRDTWPDVVVDFGRELYVPWRLSAGAVLYRDIAWFNGPFSAYANALLFRLAGPSLQVLVAVNL